MKKGISFIIMISLIASLAMAESMDYRDPSNLKTLIESERSDYLFLDVRTEGEYASGHIPKAVNIPYDTLPSSMPSDIAKDSLIILYCRAGNRSGIGAKSLVKAGYTNVQDFGGISRWKGPLEK